ncbi:MAG: PIN domain-containing protein [Sedimenticola sp.]
MIDLSVLPVGARVTVDTAPIIYLLEGHPQFSKQYQPLFERIEAGELRGIVSVVTLAEVLAGPLRHGNEILADRYYRALTSSAHWQIQEMDSELSFMAARIRARYRLKLPDAIQVATAIHSSSSALVTHDRVFSSVDEIRILGL